MQPSELRRAAGELGVSLDEVQTDRLIRYVDLIEKWNARFNLVSRRDVGRLWSRHVLDSLSIAPFIRASRTAETAITAVDIGTGAGFPGLPLAIVVPDVHWILIDRHQRKVRFLETVIAELKLVNAEARVVDLGGKVPAELMGCADVVVSRAVDEPAGLLALAEPLLGARPRLILMTGAAGNRHPDGRLPEDGGYRISTVHDLVIPGLDRTHEVTIIEPAGECPDSTQRIRT